MMERNILIAVARADLALTTTGEVLIVVLAMATVVLAVALVVKLIMICRMYRRLEDEGKESASIIQHKDNVRPGHKDNGRPGYKHNVRPGHKDNVRPERGEQN